jgi:hypothetical protein
MGYGPSPRATKFMQIALIGAILGTRLGESGLGLLAAVVTICLAVSFVQRCMQTTIIYTIHRSAACTGCN